MITASERVFAGQLASTEYTKLRQLIKFNLPNQGQEKHFIERLVKLLLQDQLELPHDEEMMNLEQAKAFEQIPMPFGKYKDELIGEIDYKYLVDLTEPNDFIKKLKKYIRFCERTRRK